MDMMTRTLLTGTAVLVVATLLLALPAAAQTSISVHAAPRFEPAVNALEELPEDGRKDFALVVDLSIEGQFVCAQETQVVVEVLPVTHPEWAGMSLTSEDDRTVLFTIPMGNNNGYSDTQPGPTANLAWDTEDAPANHTHRYVINVEEPSLSGDSTDCTPQISNAQTSVGQAFLNITYPHTDTGEEEVPCDQDPEQPKCQTDNADPNEGGGSPGIGALVAVAAVVGVVLLRRRTD